MGLEASPWQDNPQRRIERAEPTLPLNDIADGYAHQAEAIFNSPQGAAVRSELKNYLNTEALEPLQQFEELQKMARSLGAYKSAVADISEDPTERAAFALALIRREKGLQ